MVMMIGVAVVIVGVVIGWFTISGSGIHERPYAGGDAPGAGKEHGESPLDSPWSMNDWSRGTASRARKRRR